MPSRTLGLFRSLRSVRPLRTLRSFHSFNPHRTIHLRCTGVFAPFSPMLTSHLVGAVETAQFYIDLLRPYVDLVDDNPVICDIHAALVGRLLEQTGQPVRVTSMDVWARPGVCVARLRRSDLVPTRTITIDEDGPRAAEEGRTP